MNERDYFPPQPEVNGIKFQAFQKLLIAKREKPIADTFRTAVAGIDADMVASKLRASIPWLLTLLAVVVISNLVKVVRYRLSYKARVSRPFTLHIFMKR